MRHLPVLVLTVPKAQAPLTAAVRNLEPQSNVNTQRGSLWYTPVCHVSWLQVWGRRSGHCRVVERLAFLLPHSPKRCSLTLIPLVRREPEIPACPVDWGRKLVRAKCWNGWTWEKPHSVSGGFSLISRLLTDFEITASSCSVLPITDLRSFTE